jgi:transcriptional regulator with XRE-family HTH domain
MHRSLATKLRVLRAERGLTVRQAAEISGVAKETISQIERGERHPYDRTLAKLAHAYDVPVEGLLEEPALAGSPKVKGPEAAGPSEAELEQQRERAQRLMDAGVSEATARELSGEYSRSEEWWQALTRAVGIEAPAWIGPGVDLEDLHNLGIPTNATEINIVNLCIGVSPGEGLDPEGVGRIVVDETRIFALLAYVIAEGMLTEDEIEAARQTLRRKLTDEATQGSYTRST